MKSYLESRQFMYYSLVMEHKNKETFCPFFDWTKVSYRWKNAMEIAKVEHQHWLIWWSGNNRFTGSSFYTYISKYRDDFKLENYSGPPFITFNIPSYDFVTKIFQNTEGRKILNWSHTHPNYQPKPVIKPLQEFHGITRCYDTYLEDAYVFSQ